MASKDVEHLPFSQVIIIGGGLGGLDFGCELKRKMKFDDFVIYDRNPALGGTWYDNNYPGCAVDIPGFIYQLSFAPEWNFTHMFPARAQMLAYMNRVADQYDIKKHIRPNTEWLNSTWDDDRRIWSVELQNNITGKISIQECKVLIGAIGHQVDPKPFEIPGIPEFKGKIIHSCKWPEGLDLKGKNVVVSGNGSTAVQVVPNILDDVKQCIQIQRAPHWILHRPNAPVSERYKKFVGYFPFMLKFFQSVTFFLVESFFPLLGKRIPNMVKEDLEECEVPEKYRPLLTPNFTPGCKRIVFASHYLQCLKNPKVDLVQDDITSLGENSVKTASGEEYPCDVLILCHGFKADTFYYPLKGRGGITPSEHWEIAGGPSSYKGTAMHGFPNFFAIRGPNVSSGRQSLIYFIETTTALILNIASPLIKGKADLVEVKPKVEQNYVRLVQEACKKGVWGRDCSTFYVTKNGWNHTIYPWTPYWLWFHRFVNRSHWIVTRASKQKSI